MAGLAIQLTRTASTTQSLGSVTADATRPRRFRLHYVSFGCQAVSADNQFQLQVARITGAGTSTAVTPKNLDPASAATELDAGENHSGEPTYTANEEMLDQPTHQRNAFQWYAAPGREIVCPATASNGLGLKTPVGPASAITAMLHLLEE